MTSEATDNRPIKFGTGDRREYIAPDSEITIRAENDANGNPIYIGTAKPGTKEGEAKWKISFHTWDANNSLTSKIWPENSEGNASSNHLFSWTAKAGYTYS